MKSGKAGKKKGKLKSSKSKDSSISSQVEDVQVHTALPPQVEGQLRCFCRVSVSEITWTIHNPPEVTHVRVKWWGEAGDGSIFRPVDTKCPGKVAPKTTARYPVRSGPKQFAAYLNDMGSLLIEILSGRSRTPVGRAEVPQISLLSSSYPINGSFPVFSSSEEKIAELQLSLILEPLMASYDSMGSIPTSDISGHTLNSNQGMRASVPKQLQPSPYPHPVRNSTEDPFASPATNKTESRKGNDSASSGRHLDMFDTADEGRRLRPQEKGDTVFITTSGDVIRANPTGYQQTTRHLGSQVRSPVKLDINAPATTDLLGTLLDRGTKLREAMIVSSMNSETTDAPLLDIPPLTTAPLDLPMTAKITSPSKRHTAGVGMYNGVAVSPGKAHLPAESDLSDIEGRAVDLIMGSTITNKEYQYLRAFDGSPRSSISEDPDLGSELGDPLHDDTIIQELFYKNPLSDDSSISGLSGDEGRVGRKSNCSAASVEDPGNMRPSSRRSSVSSGAELAVLEKQIPGGTPNKRKSRAKVKKKTKGLKKRRRSRSSGGSVRSMSSVSDSDHMSTPRSETSRVSFDMTPSDVDEPVMDKPPKAAVDGLSVERLTLLGRVHVARVTIDSLLLTPPDLNLSTSSSKKGRAVKKGKPPKSSPKPKKPCTYFIEYQFPVVATSRDKHAPNAMATEVMRVASKNVKENGVLFNHRSVFPVYFDGSVIENWWKSALIFKVFSRTPGQKIPVQVGSCGVPLKSILKSDSLCVTKDLDVKDGTKLNTKKNSSFMDGTSLGNLRVVLELASDSKDFSSVMARTKLAELQGKAKVVPITPASPRAPLSTGGGHKYPMGPEAAKKYKKQMAEKGAHPGMSTQTEPQRTDLSSLGPPVAPPVVPQNANNPPPTQTIYPDPSHNRPVAENFESPTLYTMLLIPDGRGIIVEGMGTGHSLPQHAVKLTKPSAKVSGIEGRNLTTRNSYLVCRMFWCNDVVSSNVCWGTSEPRYGFLQVAPVLVSMSLLERMRNNYMIVEVWDKKTSAENDKLVGIVKLSLHQFYMSFRDQKIAKSLLRSQFPVISVDNYLPIMDLFSGVQVGQLKVMLAMGSMEQVSYLQRLKVDQGSVIAAPDRPLHFHERQDMVEKSQSEGMTGTDATVEHQFEVVIEGIRNLRLFEEMIWGEADCFVQYYFPAQPQSSSSGLSQQHGIFTMKSFRTATTLCLPNPSFHDITRHRLVLPPGSPVQRQLLTACSGSGHGSGGLPFEVWCRYYHPNVRDQVVAKGMLPLAKLCAMVTMQKKGESAVQTFSLPLTPALSQPNGLDPEKEAKVKDSGLMDLTVTYKSQVSQSSTGGTAAGKHQAQVCISVGVIRASGLKAAAEAIARLDSGMQYPAEVGVNTYVKVIFSFLTKEDERITRTVARNFAPEFSHHMDFPCPLLWTEADSDAFSLAEILESGELTLELWHQVPGLSSGIQEPDLDIGSDDFKGRRLVSKTSDVLLGTSTVQLTALLTHRTGINGWFPVNLSTNQWASNKDSNQSEETSPSAKGLSRVVGGVELSIKFAHHEDRERVIHAACGVGWSPLDIDVEEEEWQSEDESGGRSYQMSVSIDQACFPLHNAMIIGQNKLDSTARCYIRYKVYDKAAVVSKAHGLDHSVFGVLRSKIKHKQLLQLPDSSPFKWYLREERLEIQVWVSYGHHTEEQRPRHRDKLIGSAFINLETLGDSRRKQHQISGLFPLFKPGSATLGGAYLRVYISLKPLLGHVKQVSLIEEGSDVVEDEDFDPNDSFHQLVTKATRFEVRGQEEEEITTPLFTVHISVERAMHLPWVAEKHGSPSCPPNSYVSFQTTEVSRPMVTSVVVSSDGPVWDYQAETQLTTELLFEENKNLVFKVWHKPDTASKEPDKCSDRVLGFVSVDLVPLTTGLQQICGWYNIVDFNSQCQGQIKVSVTPLESLCQYRGGLPSSSTTEGLPSTHVSSVFYPPVISHLPWTNQLSQPSSSTEHSLPHFQEHYQNVKLHHQMLQKHAHTAPSGESTGDCPAGSVHWKPDLPEFRDEPGTTKSFLFSALRKQLNELDEINDKFKARLAMPQPFTQETAPNCTTERLPLSTRSDHQILSHRSEQANLNSTLGGFSYTSQSVGKDSARDSVSCQDSGNATGTHHETSHDLIGSHSAMPSARSTHSGEGTGANIFQTETQSGPTSQPALNTFATNTLSSELDVSEDFIKNHVPPQIQELLEAAKQIHQAAPELPGREGVSQKPIIISDEDAGNESDDEDDDINENYFHQYQDLLQRGSDVSDSEAEDGEINIIMPRALNDISGKGFYSGEVIDWTQEENQAPVPQSAHHIPRSPIPEVSSATDTDSWLADPRYASITPHALLPESHDCDDIQPGPSADPQLGKAELEYDDNLLSDNEEEGPSSDDYLGLQADNVEEDEKPHDDGDSNIALGIEIMKGGENDCDIVDEVANGTDRPNDYNYNNSCPEARISSDGGGNLQPSPRTDNSEISQGSEVKVIIDLPPLSGSGRKRSETGRSETNSENSTPRTLLTGGIDDKDRDTVRESGLVTNDRSNDGLSSGQSKQNENTLLKPNLPNFFPTAVQLEQSMKALQLVTGRSDEEVAESRSQEKSAAAQEYVQRLSKGSNLTKTTKFKSSGIKNKPLPTADETKRIAKIFASKFA